MDATAELLDGLVARILETEDWDQTLAWIRQPGRFSGLLPVDDADATRAMAVMLARSVWNVTPLPGNRFRPQPLPKPQRSAPCPCGSGRKYKHCCRDLPEAGFDTDAIWAIALDHLDRKQIHAAIETHAVPMATLMEMAARHLEEQHPGKAKNLLEPVFEGDPGALDERHETALDMLLDTYDELGHTRKKQALLDRVMANAKASLRAAAWQRFATMLADQGDWQDAWDAFGHAQRLAPNHPYLAALEITLLINEGREKEVKARARFWHARLSQQPDTPEDLLDFLASAEADPLQALVPSSADDLAAFHELTDCIAAAAARPVPAYTLAAPPVAQTEDEALDDLRRKLLSLGADETQIEHTLADARRNLSLQQDNDTTDAGDDAPMEPVDEAPRVLPGCARRSDAADTTMA